MEDISTPVSLRFFDVSNLEDIEAYRLVDVEPEVRFWMDEDPMETDEEIIKHLSNITEFLVLAICSKKDSKIIGWVQLTYDDPYHIIQLGKDGSMFENFTDIIEVSYARHTNSNDMTKGLISSAVRQACYIFNESFKQVFPYKKLIITAYANIKNLPSERVLEKSFFTKTGEVFYYEDESSIKDNLWVLDIEKLNDSVSGAYNFLLPNEIIKQFIKN